MIKSAKSVMMSAHAFCPLDMSHPQRMAWMADYFLKNYKPRTQQWAVVGWLRDRVCLDSEAYSSSSKPGFSPVYRPISDDGGERNDVPTTHRVCDRLPAIPQIPRHERSGGNL